MNIDNPKYLPQKNLKMTASPLDLLQNSFFIFFIFLDEELRMWPFRISSSGSVKYLKIATGVSTTNNNNNNKNNNKFHYAAKVSLENAKDFTIVFTRIGMTLIGL
jgi:hypothetical protein